MTVTIENVVETITSTLLIDVNATPMIDILVDLQNTITKDTNTKMEALRKDTQEAVTTCHNRVQATQDRFEQALNDVDQRLKASHEDFDRKLKVSQETPHEPPAKTSKAGTTPADGLTPHQSLASVTAAQQNGASASTSA